MTGKSDGIGARSLASCYVIICYGLKFDGIKGGAWEKLAGARDI